MNNNKLNILWTNADPITSELMLLMYAKNSLEKGLWDQVNVIIWGATAKLIKDNEHIQNLVKDAMKSGVVFGGCIVCATELGAVNAITNLGIELEPMGGPLTEIIKSKENLITI